MKILCVVLVGLLGSIVSNAQRLPLSTTSDSCTYYYYLGWKNVLDDGDYSASEHSYRKMMMFDPHFLLGMSLLGRISSNAAERDSIELILQERKSHVKNDERLLLDVFIELLTMTNLRARDPDKANRQREQVFQLAEKNLRTTAHRYPNDLHTKSEYIEVLHYRYGPRVALDSLARLASVNELENPFLLGYAAAMEAELGMFDMAVQKAQRLQDILKGKRVPKPHTVWADIYYKMGKKEWAETAVDKALAIDPGSIDAQRLKAKINQMK
jgi:tetratricopeptide (TPR) repeat protein